MSTSYYLYAVQEKDKKLVCINPVFRHDDKTTLTRTFESWSRSYFGQTAQKLQEIGWDMKYDDLPDALKAEFPKHVDDDYMSIVKIALDDVRKCIPRNQKHEFHGIVSKNSVFAYESGDIEELYEEDISLSEFAKMDDMFKQKYQYYEWDDPFGWFKDFKDILEHVDWQIYDWESDYNNKDDKNGKYYLILFIC